MPIDFYDTLYGFVYYISDTLYGFMYYISDTYGKKAMDIFTGQLLPYYLHDQELLEMNFLSLIFLWDKKNLNHL